MIDLKGRIDRTLAYGLAADCQYTVFIDTESHLYFLLTFWLFRDVPESESAHQVVFICTSIVTFLHTLEHSDRKNWLVIFDSFVGHCLLSGKLSVFWNYVIHEVSFWAGNDCTDLVRRHITKGQFASSFCLRLYGCHDSCSLSNCFVRMQLLVYWLVTEKLREHRLDFGYARTASNKKDLSYFALVRPGLWQNFTKRGHTSIKGGLA